MKPTFKICRNCYQPSPAHCRKCRNKECRGNRFDAPTEQQIADAEAKAARMKAFVERLELEMEAA